MRSSQKVEIKNGKNPIDLAELVDAFDSQSDSLFFYVNQSSGKIVALTEEEVEAIEEEGEDLESCEAKDILDSDDYIGIPSKWELDEYEIMADFVFLLENAEMQDVLTRAIRGKGAFGRFRTAIQIYKIEDQWYRYQKGRLRKKVIEWCDQNGLIYQ